MSSAVRSRPVARNAWPWVTALMMLLAVASVLAATRQGVGLSPDSGAYIVISRSLAQFEGAMAMDIDGDPRPATHYPPGAAAALAPSYWLGVPVHTWAAGVGAVCMAGCIGLMLTLVRRTGAAPVAGVVAGAAFFTPGLLETFSHLWSEPLYLLLMSAALLLLVEHAHRPRYGLALAAGLLVGLGCLTRYAGIFLVGGGTLAVLLVSQMSWSQRLARSAVFALAAGLLPGLWALRNRLLAGSTTNREAAFNPPKREELLSAAQTFAEWLAPAPSSGLMWLLVGLGVVLVVLALRTGWHARDAARDAARDVGWRREGDEGEAAAEAAAGRRAKAVGVLSLCGLTYGVFIYTSKTWFDAHTPFDFRIFSPLQVMLIGLMGVGVVGPVSRGLPGWGPKLLALLLGVFVLGQAVRGTAWVAAAPQGSLGFHSDRWRNSELIAYTMQNIPETVPVFTNAPDAFYLLHDRLPGRLPQRYNLSTRREDPGYRRHLASVSEGVEAGGRIVYFDGWRRGRVIDQQQLVDDLGLELEYRAADGSVWRAAGEPDR
ncbi:MAG: glycosyltransferase 87 family protein [Phycisphaerae bacterium]